MILRQRLAYPVNGWWDGGKKSVFDWEIEPRSYVPGKVRIGSYAANHWFHVKPGKTEKATLGNARRHLHYTSVPSTFEYIEEE